MLLIFFSVRFYKATANVFQISDGQAFETVNCLQHQHLLIAQMFLFALSVH
jgi:hypothetical protein